MWIECVYYKLSIQNWMNECLNKNLNGNKTFYNGYKYKKFYVKLRISSTKINRFYTQKLFI